MIIIKLIDGRNRTQVKHVIDVITCSYYPILRIIACLSFPLITGFTADICQILYTRTGALGLGPLHQQYDVHTPSWTYAGGEVRLESDHRSYPHNRSDGRTRELAAFPGCGAMRSQLSRVRIHTDDLIHELQGGRDTADGHTGCDHIHRPAGI